MISIAQYELSCNGDTTKILSKESSLCPICGGALKVHGTCTRKVRYGDCIHKYHLRVLKCQCCGKTHRELPDSLIPYKRYGVEAFCEIAESSALGTTPEIAFKSDSMPPRFVDKALMARAFLHCESRKADKSGVISFGGKRYDLGIAFAGKQVDVVYDPICTEILTIETPDHEPFQVRQIVVGEKVAPKPKRKEIERIPVDHSRLLDAITEPYQDKQRRRAISYTTEIEKG